jgi:cell division transport system permease protein
MQENKFASRRLRTSYLSTIMSISLVLFMLGLLSVIIVYAGKLSNYVKENIELSIILNESIKEPEIALLQQELNTTKFVKSTQYVTTAEAAKKLQKDLGEDFVNFLGYNPLLPSIDVHLHARYANQDSIKWIEKKIATHPEVKEIHYQHSLVDLVNEHLRIISLVILVFSGLLAVIAIALINNNIRLSLYSKRFLIRSMQLVGATQGFIRKPFIVKGMVHGFYGALIANVLLAGILYIAQRQIPELMVLQDMKLFGQLFLAVIVAGVLISFVSTYMAVRKYIRLKLDDLYF